MPDLLLSQADDNRSVVVNLGDRIIIQLAENPTTGFRWELDGAIGPSLSLLSSDFRPDQAVSVGGGGTRLFAFLAGQPGVTPLRLKLKRSWQQDDAAIGRFHVNVRVEG